MKVTIIVRTVGQAFGCEAVVRCGRRTIHTTAVYPYGHRGNAYVAAEAWAARNGHSVVEG